MECFYVDQKKGELWLKTCTDGWQNDNIDPLPEGLKQDYESLTIYKCTQDFSSIEEKVIIII
jgi:hypothetical protein